MTQEQNNDSLFTTAGQEVESHGLPSFLCSIHLGPHVSTVPRNKPELA